MKTKTILLLTLLSLQISAQDILNPSFDSVYFGGIDRVFEWITSDGMMMNAGSWTDTVQPLQPNTYYPPMGLQFHELLWMGQRVDTSPHSNIALQLWSHPEKVKPDGTYYESLVVNGNQFWTDSNGFIDLSRCGVPYTSRPDILYGWYRFVDSTLIGLNTGRCILLLKKWNASKGHSDTIAFVDNTTTLGPQSSWSAFQIPLTYYSNDAPDSLVLAFIANSRPDQQSILWLDEILLGPGVGIEDESIEDISVFPNPTARYIQVEEAHRFKRFLLIDETGRTVMQGEMTNRIDLSKVANGSYLLKLEGDHSNYKTVRVVKSE